MTLDFDNSGIYELLLKVCSPYGVDPSSSVEAENFFRKLLEQYTGDTAPDHLSSWLSNQITEHFYALASRPRWIQSPNWPVKDGIPMVFVGQIDISVKGTGTAMKIFHDDTSFYVFVDRQGRPKVIVQQF